MPVRKARGEAVTVFEKGLCLARDGVDARTILAN